MKVCHLNAIFLKNELSKKIEDWNQLADTTRPVRFDDAPRLDGQTYIAELG